MWIRFNSLVIFSYCQLTAQWGPLVALVAWSTNTAGTTRQALNSRQQGLPSCWSPCLEHPAGRDDISTITGDFLSTSENLAFQTVLHWTYNLIQRLSKFISLLTIWPRRSSATEVLWLIDWLECTLNVLQFAEFGTVNGQSRAAAAEQFEAHQCYNR